MATAKIIDVSSDAGGIGVVIEFDDQAGTVGQANLYFPYNELAPINNWNEFLTSLLKPAAQPFLDKMKKISAAKALVETKKGIVVTLP